MTGWTIRVEEFEVEILGFPSNLTHTSIAIYDPNGARGTSFELVTNGGSFGSSFNVVFQSAAEREVNENPQSFVTGLSQAQAQQLLAEAFSAAAYAWTRGGGYELPPSISVNSSTLSLGIALGSGAFFPPEAYRDYFDSISGLKDPYTHNSNAFARLMHDQIVALAQVYGYGDVTPILDDIFELPAPGWEYTERFGYHPNVPDVGAHCFLGDSTVQMWPLDPSIKSRLDGSYDEKLVLTKVWYKRQDQMQAGDLVVCYDKQGRLQPSRVTRTMTNTATHILDFWGTGVTPGHAVLCGEGPFKSQHVPMLDILRSDGAIVRDNGTLVRAATGCEVGSRGDRMLHAVCGHLDSDGCTSVQEQGQIRAGTRVILENKQHVSVLELIEANGGTLSEDGYVQTEPNGVKMPYRWGFSDRLPNPEDYILARSNVTLEEIYAAGEWEQIGPKTPPPDALGGFVRRPSNAKAIRPNIPPNFADHPDAPIRASVADYWNDSD